MEYIKNFIKNLEDSLAIIILLLMAFLPTLMVFSRLIGVNGISATTLIVQNLTLWIAFIGAIIATRENKLLSLLNPIEIESKINFNFKFLFSRIVTLFVTLFLALSSFLLVNNEFQYGTDNLIGFPIWFIQSIMPIGFLFIFFELLKPFNIKQNFIILFLIGIFLILLFITVNYFNFDYRNNIILWLNLILLMSSIILGAPIFIGLGGLALLFFWFDSVPIAAIPIEMYRIVVSPTLPTIPLFTLSGYLLANGGASKRLIEVFKSWFSWIPGGTPVVVTLVCGFFTALTGGSGVTILALGGLLLPMLIAENYPKNFSSGLITVSGSLGLLFPPSLAVIIYGVTAGVPINKIFIGGIIPGLLLIIMVSIWGVRQGFIAKVSRQKFNYKDAFKALWEAKWEVFIPIFILIGIFGGFTTLVEVSAFTVVYVLIIEMFVYKDLNLKEIPRVIIDCATLVGGVLIILGVAMGFTSYLVDAQIPILALDWVRENIQSKYVFLFALNILLLLAGCLMDIFSAIIVLVPLIKPMANYFEVDPVHLAVIFIANLELGYLTPPVGMNLFLSAYRFEKDMTYIYKSVLPFFIILLFTVLAITYIPLLSLIFL